MLKQSIKKWFSDYKGKKKKATSGKYEVKTKNTELFAKK